MSETSNQIALHSDQNKVTSRRMVLGQSMLASACFVTGAIQQSAKSAVVSQDSDEILLPETPEQALKMLYDGNHRFAQQTSLAVNRDMSRVKAVSKEQKPFAAFLRCADSRVPIAIVFDQGFGDLFVTQIAGNVASSENIGSLEFGTHVLGAKVLYVLGHTNCGAVIATMAGSEGPGTDHLVFRS